VTTQGVFCRYCGQPLTVDSLSCPHCGKELAASSPPAEQPQSQTDSVAMPQSGLASVKATVPLGPDSKGVLSSSVKRVVYAGFWLRLLAYLIDYAFCLIGIFGLVFVVTIAAALGFELYGHELTDDEWESLAGAMFYAIGLPGIWLYYALSESSSLQATLGKKILGLAVTDEKGRRITFGRATGRYFGKILSGFPIGAGFIMAAFTEKKQALHDQLADCLVIRRT
jgi:uncharacterized RDD family membrane protein YckC